MKLAVFLIMVFPIFVSAEQTTSSILVEDQNLVIKILEINGGNSVTLGSEEFYLNVEVCNVKRRRVGSNEDDKYYCTNFAQSPRYHVPAHNTVTLNDQIILPLRNFKSHFELSRRAVDHIEISLEFMRNNLILDMPQHQQFPNPTLLIGAKEDGDDFFVNSYYENLFNTKILLGNKFGATLSATISVED